MNGAHQRGLSRRAPVPGGFLWGAGTSSYQIEGAVDEDGRGRSIWDVFTPHAAATCAAVTPATSPVTPTTAWTTTWRCWRAGRRRLPVLVAWPRVQPTGAGAVNQRGLDYYRALVDELRRARDRPGGHALPLGPAAGARGSRRLGQPRHRASAWPSTRAVVATRSATRSGMWITVNEPKQAVHQGYRIGTHAPGHRDDALAAAAHPPHPARPRARAGRRCATRCRRGRRSGITLDPHPYRAARRGRRARR